MNTKLIMTLSAVFLAIMGISLTFFPMEISDYFDLNSTKAFHLIGQILGSLYFAFAMLNWMTKGSFIGGIYNRPIAVANFTHFFIGGLALIKGVAANHGLPYIFWILAGIYSVFALLFGLILFRNPAIVKEASN